MNVATVESSVAEIATVFDEVFSPITAWKAALVADLAGGGSRSRARVDAVVEALVTPELRRTGGHVIGAGFVAAPGFLSDAPWHLAWWLGEGNTFGTGGRRGRIRRLEAVEDPAADSFRDHTTLEWWRVPARTQLRHITGPYVDYVCTDDYTLTLTEPVLLDEGMAGVVGADLYVREAERVLLPPLRRIGPHASLVNESGRIVVSTDPRLATGALLRIDGLGDAIRGLVPGASAQLGDGKRAVACGDTAFAVVTTD